MRSRVIQLLKPLFAFPVENSLRSGSPDVCCVAGWLELKVAYRQNGIIPVDLRTTQRLWLRQWRRHGGRAWTLTMLGQSWHLHDGLWSVENLGSTTEFEMENAAIAVWKSEPTSEALCKSLLS